MARARNLLSLSQVEKLDGFRKEQDQLQLDLKKVGANKVCVPHMMVYGLWCMVDMVYGVWCTDLIGGRQ